MRASWSWQFRGVERIARTLWANTLTDWITRNHAIQRPRHLVRYNYPSLRSWITTGLLHLINSPATARRASTQRTRPSCNRCIRNTRAGAAHSELLQFVVTPARLNALYCQRERAAMVATRAPMDRKQITAIAGRTLTAEVGTPPEYRCGQLTQYFPHPISFVWHP